MTLLAMEEAFFAFDKDRVILEDAQLHIKRGQHTTLTGDSGSGKSTVLKLLANLISLDRGQILLKGRAMEEYPFTSYRQKVSYVMQNPVLFGRTVRDNLAFPAQIRKASFDEARAQDLMMRLHLEEISLEQGISELSGGEAQRVGLIRNLMIPPMVLLLDEVTASLDEVNSERVWDLLFEMAAEQSMTLIWVSHKAADRNRAEQVLKMSPEARGFERLV